MTEEVQSYRPGMIVPESGIYECDGDCGHRWSTDVKGNRFPADSSRLRRHWVEDLNKDTNRGAAWQLASDSVLPLHSCPQRPTR